MKFAASLSTEGDVHRAIEQVCSDLEASFTDGPPDLGFVFFTPHHGEDAATIAGEIKRRTGIRNLLGCTGESVIGGGREVEGEPALSLWAASLPDVTVSTFALGCEDTPDGFFFPLTPPDRFESVTEDHVVIFLGDPFSIPVDTYLKRFNEDHPGVPVVGGMASGAMAPGENALLLDEEVWERGAVGVVLSGAVRVRTVVSQGCRPIGEPLVITDCDRNSILKLGGATSLTKLQELFQTLSEEDRRLFQRAPHVGVVMNETQPSFGPGDFLIRNVIGADPAREAIFVSDNVRRGQTVQFHVRDADAASRDLESLLAREMVDCDGHAPVAGLVFSCNGRGTRMFAGPDHDISALRDAAGDLPVAGFFAAGELGPVGGRNHLHGFTACVVLFSTEP